MRILHTSDWHVGKVLKGQSRVEEHIAVLRQVVEVAQAERPDLVVVAGDLYDTAAPTPDATRLVTRALSALRNTGADVVAIAGNHDNGAALDALRAWAEAAGITLRGSVRDRAADHIVEGRTRGGEAWRMVALPFLSQRYAIRATEMFDLSAAEATQTYADHVGRLLATLSEGFGPDTVNLVTAHLTVIGGTMGGGERDAHTIQAYAVPATVFSPGTHYVALGHLHRAQSILAPCPVHYSGSPLAVDFGEEENTPSVTIVEVGTQQAAKIRQVPVTAAVPLRTVRGTLDELAKVKESDGWLRVYVRERPRAGLREAVQDLLPRALEVRIDPSLVAEMAAADSSAQARRAGRAPGELFSDYLRSRGHADPAVGQLFDRLYGEVRAS
ncbi:exonuclease SbcCD subunit D [Rugosimonospora africana]|uniref:Nuclease SbcCD subunit D n=1 Tax=Rugosimonospora africana TaxID=556532 RepID=A0A8J3QP69_9ACTN|nr:exonuclease SbcCD subunit D [Rugosimonospora africana]GIH13834.1 nuclease SbcCD subunit D [Rugosimonospora africana]